ncbi:hypothetical protein BDZ89DRAFT_1166308 [Hymenopellis radicata]|nr:hypothetical protein BDZ89DRAFT_1166308 [Hymenopellis radicata]
MKTLKDFLGARRGRKSKESSSRDSARFKSSSPPVIISPSAILVVSTPRSSPMPRLSPMLSPSPQPSDWQSRIHVLERENERLKKEAVVRDENLKRLQRSYNELLRHKSPAPQRRVKKQPSKARISVYQDATANSKFTPSSTRFVSRIPVRALGRSALPSKVTPFRLSDSKHLTPTPTRSTPPSTRRSTPSREIGTPTPAGRTGKQSITLLKPQRSVSSIKARSPARRASPLSVLRPNLPALTVPLSQKATRHSTHDCKGKENGVRPTWV